jgi:hypothetical protein
MCPAGPLLKETEVKCKMSRVKCKSGMVKEDPIAAA